MFSKWFVSKEKKRVGPFPFRKSCIAQKNRKSPEWPAGEVKALAIAHINLLILLQDLLIFMADL
ncbi:MAG: hypothetical protein D6814_06435 [Calditrichaeota bacterium]|nr:MAG: hypothetical protein D6814_06435 [Calditrichota bacterium]